MQRKSLNRLLAINLKREIDARGLNERSLGRLAGVAANTVGNYVDETPQFTAKGKERSAELAMIEKIAIALKIDPLSLLMDHEAQHPPLTDAEAELIQICRSLPPERREKVELFAEALLPWSATGQHAAPAESESKPERLRDQERPGA